MDELFEEPPHVMVVESRFYEDIADKMLEAALKILDNAGATYEVFSVPGALEIPAAIKFAIKGLDYYTARKRFDAYVALGCVIRGETAHFDIVSRESARGLMDLSINNTICLGNGILTVENRKQAEARIEKGADAARVALEMLSLKSGLGIYPRN